MVTKSAFSSANATARQRSVGRRVAVHARCRQAQVRHALRELDGQLSSALTEVPMVYARRARRSAMRPPGRRVASVPQAVTPRSRARGGGGSQRPSVGCPSRVFSWTGLLHELAQRVGCMSSTEVILMCRIARPSPVSTFLGSSTRCPARPECRRAWVAFIRSSVPFHSQTAAPTDPDGGMRSALA